MAENTNETISSQKTGVEGVIAGAKDAPEDLKEKYVYPYIGFPKDYVEQREKSGNPTSLNANDISRIEKDGRETLERIYNEKFASQLDGLEVAEKPVFFALSAAPGTGKSHMMEQLKDEFNTNSGGKPCTMSLSTDEGRYAHPDADTIRKQYPEYYDQLVTPFANKIRDFRVMAAKERNLNIIFESVPVGKGGADRIANIRGLLGDGYDAMFGGPVVPRQVSLASARFRRHYQQEENGSAPPVPVEKIDASYDEGQGTAWCAKDLLDRGIVSKVVFQTRDVKVKKSVTQSSEVSQAYDACRTHYTLGEVVRSNNKLSKTMKAEKKRKKPANRKKEYFKGKKGAVAVATPEFDAQNLKDMAASRVDLVAGYVRQKVDNTKVKIDSAKRDVRLKVSDFTLAVKYQCGAKVATTFNMVKEKLATLKNQRGGRE